MGCAEDSWEYPAFSYMPGNLVSKVPTRRLSGLAARGCHRRPLTPPTIDRLRHEQHRA